MPVGHFQPFRFSLASEAVLPDTFIMHATPLPTCVLELVRGTVSARQAILNSVDRAEVTIVGDNPIR